MGSQTKRIQYRYDTRGNRALEIKFAKPLDRFQLVKVELLDGTIQVEHPDAFEMARRAAREEGLFIGASSGASLQAVKQKLPELPAGSRVLTVSYDTGERYLSVDGFLP